MKPDALARNVNGIAVNDTCLARDLGMGRQWGCQGEQKKYKAQEHGAMMAFSE